jgi:hypothetical protein
MKGETTVERYGRKPRNKSRMPLLDTPRKRLSLDFYNDEIEEFEGNGFQRCYQNCFKMSCTFRVTT